MKRDKDKGMWTLVMYDYPLKPKRMRELLTDSIIF